MSEFEKAKYDLGEIVKGPDFTRLYQKTMNIWRKTEEGTEMYDLVKNLLDAIEEEKGKNGEIKSLAFFLANKI